MVSSAAVSAALVSTSLISLAPNLILLAFPDYATQEALAKSYFLSLGQAVAAGGLLGDVFLHTLSHAVDYEGEHVGLWLLCGFGIFLILDVMIRSMEDGHNHHNLQQYHSHASEDGKHAEGSPHEKKRETNGTADNASSDDDDDKKESSWFLPSSIVLNLTGDALHNFTDGLAIGASFATSHTIAHGGGDVLSLLTSRGGLAAVSILFHEIPHELGDYCILVKGGLTKGQAIFAQFVTAIAAFHGTLLGLWAVQGWQGGERLIYVTAGGFVYLAATTILPQLLDERASAKLRLLQLCAFGLGIAFMYTVTLLEDVEEHSNHGNHHSVHAHYEQEHHDHHHSTCEHHHHDHHHNKGEHLEL